MNDDPRADGMASISVIDTHVHVWDRRAPWMSWLAQRPRSWDAVRRDFTWGDLRAVLDRAGVARLLLVQAATSVAETDLLLRLAAEQDSVIGVVGWVTLSEPRATERDLRTLETNNVSGDASRNLVGIRSLHQWEPDGDVLATPGVLESCQLLADRGLTLDLFFNSHRELPLAIAIAERTAPRLRLIIDHLGRPPIGLDAEFGSWATAMQTLAEFPNVYVKYSGWATVVERVCEEDVRPYLHRALEYFGAERLMFASNWPVALVAGGYQETYDATVAAVRELPTADRAAIFAGAAERCYLGR